MQLESIINLTAVSVKDFPQTSTLIYAVASPWTLFVMFILERTVTHCKEVRRTHLLAAYLVPQEYI